MQPSCLIPPKVRTILAVPDVLAYAVRGRDLPPRPAAGRPQPGAPRSARPRRFGRYARASARPRVRAAAARVAVSCTRMASAARDGWLHRGRPTRQIGDPPDWDPDAPLLWLFNLHYFAFLHALPRPSRRARPRLDRAPTAEPRPPGWMPYPLSLRLRHWAQRLFDGPRLRRGSRARVLASIEGAGRLPRRHARAPPPWQPPARERHHAQASSPRASEGRRRAALGAAAPTPCCDASCRAVPARRWSLRALADVPRAARPTGCSTS